MKAFLKKNSTLISTLLILVLLLILIFIFKPPCLIRYITGISCPSCGITRATFALLRLDFASAFIYHPLWIALPPAIMIAIILYFKQASKVFYTYTFIAISVYVAVWIVRIIAGDPAVSINIESGAIYRLFVWLGEQVTGFLNT